MDIYKDNLTAKEILYKLSHPMEICKYCSENQLVDWEKETNEPELSHYFVE